MLEKRSLLRPVAALAMLCLLIAIVGCRGSAIDRDARPGSNIIEGSRTTVPFEIIDGAVIFQLRIAGQQHWAMLDTGAPYVIVDKSLTAQWPVRDQTASVTDANNTKMAAPLVGVPSIALGSARFEHINANSIDLKRVLGDLGRPIDCVVGRGLFGDVLLTVDYPSRQLVLESGALPEPDGKQVLPVQLTAVGRWLIPTDMAGRQLWAIPDTGATHGLSIPPDIAALFPEAKHTIPGAQVRFWASSAQASLVRLNGELRVGCYSASRPAVSIVGAGAPALGYELLRNFRITFDQHNLRIRLQQVTQPELTGPLDPGINLIRGTAIIASFAPGSHGAQAGLRPGDIIVTANGVPFDARNTKQRIIGYDDRSLSLNVRRGNQTLDVAVPLTPIVP